MRNNLFNIGRGLNLKPSACAQDSGSRSPRESKKSVLGDAREASQKQILGQRGEALAAEFLEQQGYRLMFRNYRTKLGEIDVIAQDGPTICFIEVKARATRTHGAPEEAVTLKKQRQICRAALSYLLRYNQTRRTCRFDVVSIVDDGNSSAPEIRLIKDAFPLQQPYAL